MHKMQSHTLVTGYEYVFFETRRQSQLEAVAAEGLRAISSESIRTQQSEDRRRPSYYEDHRTPFNGVKVNDGGEDFLDFFRKRSKRR